LQFEPATVKIGDVPMKLPQKKNSWFTVITHGGTFLQCLQNQEPNKQKKNPTKQNPRNRKSNKMQNTHP
jgi:hypothetical protein